jgi:hypothetical protein
VTPSPIFAPYREKSQEALGKLSQNPCAYRRLFEPLRLLRDRFEPVYQKALAVAKANCKELDPKLRENLLDELHLHVWDFTYKPEILKWMRELVAADSSESAVRLSRALDQVDSYNADRLRLAAADDARRKQERMEALVGVVTVWQMSKIYEGGGRSANELVAVEFAPEKGAVPDAGWTVVQSDKDGVVNIAGAFEKAKAKGPYTKCAVYLRATLEVPDATDAQLQLGSDDGIKVWINDKEVFANPVCRPLAIGQDKTKVHLDKGVNSLLVKITQDHSGWEAYARVRAVDGGVLPSLKIGLPQ